MEEFQRGLRMGHTPSKAFRIRVFLFSAFSGDLAAMGVGDGHDYFAFERCLLGAVRGLSSRWTPLSSCSLRLLCFHGADATAETAVSSSN